MNKRIKWSIAYIWKRLDSWKRILQCDYEDTADIPSELRPSLSILMPSFYIQTIPHPAEPQAALEVWEKLSTTSRMSAEACPQPFRLDSWFFPLMTIYMHKSNRIHQPVISRYIFDKRGPAIWLTDKKQGK